MEGIMGAIKLWIVNIGLKQMGPSLVRATIGLLVGFLMAHQGMLEKFGVVYDHAANTLTLHIGVLQEWALGAGLGLVTAFLTAAQHHTTAAITGAPQIPQGESK